MGRNDRLNLIIIRNHLETGIPTQFQNGFRSFTELELEEHPRQGHDSGARNQPASTLSVPSSCSRTTLLILVRIDRVSQVLIYAVAGCTSSSPFCVSAATAAVAYRQSFFWVLMPRTTSRTRFFSPCPVLRERVPSRTCWSPSFLRFTGDPHQVDCLPGITVRLCSERCCQQDDVILDDAVVERILAAAENCLRWFAS